MAKIRLKNQQAYADNIAPKVQALKRQMNDRIDVWQRVSREKKKQWVKSDKDPIMTLAWDMYKYLRNNFFEGVD